MLDELPGQGFDALLERARAAVASWLAENPGIAAEQVLGDVPTIDALTRPLDNDGMPCPWREEWLDSSVSRYRHVVALNDDGTATVSPAPVEDSMSTTDFATYLDELHALGERATALAYGVGVR